MRKATREIVWFWVACSKEIKGSQARVVPYNNDGSIATRLVDKAFKEIILRISDEYRMRIGENIWIVLCSAVPKSGLFPTDLILGYDLILNTEENGEPKTTKISDLKLRINYPPFDLPTFIIGEKKNSTLATGSCRRPGAHGEDAHNVFDEFMATNAADPEKRPSSLLLSGDQIYGDDVAVPLFKAVQKIAKNVFGYVEKIPKADGSGYTSVDYFTHENPKWTEEPGAGRGSKWAPGPEELWSGRKQLSHRITSPIGFSTEDGEAHLLSFAEYASMYLAVWSPELCKLYGVDDGSVPNLEDFPTAVQSSRRVMANIAVYMLCDDHEVTDDWNLDEPWETATKASPLATRIISNGLAAYWAFQAWGNEPGKFNKDFRDTLFKHFERLRTGKGMPGPTSYFYDKQLMNFHWTFTAASNPKAICVDTRTRREYRRGESVVLSGKKVWPAIKEEMDQQGLPRAGLLLLVLPTPFLPHRSMLYIQSKLFKYPSDRYEGDYELYANNTVQRSELMDWLKNETNLKALVVFSGDVHHGSVVTGRYAWGADMNEMMKGNAQFVIRLVQVTSSPIKNIKKDAYMDKKWYTFWTDPGNIGESIIPSWEQQYAIRSQGVIAMHASVRDLKGPLGRKTYVFENHFCVVKMPLKADDPSDIMFVGVKDGRLRTANITVDTDNDATKFRFIKGFPPPN